MLKDVIRFTAGSASWALLFGLMLAVGRILGPQDFGRFAWAIAYAYLIDPLLDAGFYRLTIRKTSLRPGAAALYLTNSLIWKSALGLLIIVALALGVLPTSHDPRVARAVLLLVAAGILRSITDAFRSALIGRGHFVRDVLSLGGERAALFLAGLWILMTGGGLIAVCAVFVAIRSVAAAASWRLARGMNLRPRLDRRFLRPMAVSGSLVAVAGVFLALGGHIEVVVLGALRNATEAGWYSAAHWTRAALLIVPGVMGAVLAPRLARRHHEDPAGFEVLFGGGVKYACAAGMAVTANGLLLAPDVIRALFGEGFAPAAHTLTILLLGLPPLFGLAFLQGSLLTIDRARRVFGIAALGLAVHVALSLSVVPRYGADGAAVATVAAETALFFGFYAAVRRRIPGVAVAVFLKAPGAFAAALVGSAVIAGQGMVVQLATANALFAVALLFSGFVGVPERRALRAAVHRRPDGALPDDPQAVSPSPVERDATVVSGVRVE